MILPGTRALIHPLGRRCTRRKTCRLRCTIGKWCLHECSGCQRRYGRGRNRILMRAHVPGPWRLESETRGPEGDELLITDARGDVNIACALFAARDSGCCDYEEAAKNACLIAAAPALLT